MKLEGSLTMLRDALRGRAELEYKEDIQLAARTFGRATQSAWFPSAEPLLNGDDTAVLASSDGFTLFAAEGMRSELVAADPWFAGFCSIMVNLNDVAAMGGRPWAVVDVLFLGAEGGERVLEGMAAASLAFGVPVVGGHTARVAGPTSLAVAVLGRARRVLSSAAARPGQRVLMAVDLKGTFRGSGGNFNAATSASHSALRAALAVMPELAEAGLVAAAKDISMAGTCGSLLMLLEASGVGATLDVTLVPAPPDVDPLRWLTAFPSFGFVLTVDRAQVAAVCARFDAVGVACAEVGEVTTTRKLELCHGSERAVYWDLGEAPFTGFGG